MIGCKINTMEIEIFDKSWFKNSKTLKKVVSKYSSGVTSGGVTIIGGSKLFHGAPLMALKAAARIVSMVYFGSPDDDKGVAEKLKSSLFNFIWVPFEDVGSYISKSDAILIGPGMMRSHVNEHGFVCDDEGVKTRNFALNLLTKYSEARWVIDGGALQVLSVNELPKNSMISPNRKEFVMLFGEEMEEDYGMRAEQIFRLANKYDLVILTKDEISIVSDGKRTVKIFGGNEGLIKGATGDLIAGILVGFMAKDDPLFSACAASYLTKKAAEKLAETRGLMFNTDDVADAVPEIYGEVMKNL